MPKPGRAAAALRAAREKKGLNQSGLAKRMVGKDKHGEDKDPSAATVTLCRLEKGKNAVTVERAFELESAIGAEPGSIVSAAVEDLFERVNHTTQNQSHFGLLAKCYELDDRGWLEIRRNAIAKLEASRKP